MTHNIRGIRSICGIGALFSDLFPLTLVLPMPAEGGLVERNNNLVRPFPPGRLHSELLSTLVLSLVPDGSSKIPTKTFSTEYTA